MVSARPSLNRHEDDDEYGDPRRDRQRVGAQVAGLRAAEGDKSALARQVGALVAERAKAAGISAVVFDRGGNRYAGRIAALADGAREGWLDF